MSAGGVEPRRQAIEVLRDSLLDVILKGANALDVGARRAAVLIGNPDGGIAGAVVPAVVGRRVRLIVPVGLVVSAVSMALTQRFFQ